jgi:hypothetical protein
VAILGITAIVLIAVLGFAGVSGGLLLLMYYLYYYKQKRSLFRRHAAIAVEIDGGVAVPARQSVLPVTGRSIRNSPILPLPGTNGNSVRNRSALPVTGNSVSGSVVPEPGTSFGGIYKCIYI